MVAGIAAQGLGPLMEAAMGDQPQFAYLLSRQTSDALDRVAAHCTAVTQQVASPWPNPFSHQRQSAQLKGGLQLSLDLSKAFDKMPRQQIQVGLEVTGAPSELVQFFLFVHHDIVLVFSKEDYTAELRASTGIHQGLQLRMLFGFRV